VKGVKRVQKVSDLENISSAVLRGDVEEAERLTQKAVVAGLDVEQISQKGLIEALETMGQRWKLGEVYLPEVLMSAEAVKRGMAVIEQKLPANRRSAIAKVSIGTVKGDIHDIGKGLVAMMLRTFGFDVEDLGINVSSERFVAAASTEGTDIVCMSALLSTVLAEMQQSIREIRETGCKVSVMVGGAPVSQEFSDEIGADGYAPDATSAVDKAREIMARVGQAG
jgi:5-methyltetrahydrofolate--homocysteine methyltransferase